MHMLLSMTGYGRASKSYKDKNITIEIKSLNGKSSDLRMKVPSNFKEYEIELRRIIMNGAIRGKVDASVSIESLAGDEEYGLNTVLFKKYFEELSTLDIPNKENTDYIQAILRIPNVIKSIDTQLEEGEWILIQELAKEAVVNLTTYRATEGKVTHEDLTERVHSIQENLAGIEKHETGRIDRLKARLKAKLEEFISNEKVDPNRYEQELIYYMEKLDINEEKVRLSQHCKYFLEELNNNDSIKGKKLGFISQEMGREINTLGSKAQDSDIQQYVVAMKDELEKIKEQLLNIV